MNQHDSQDDPRSPAEIEAEIGRTRSELGLTLNALERKLAARQLVEKGFDMLKDSIDSSAVVQRGMETIRDNPIPVALIGLGVTWLIARNTGLAETVANNERVRAAGQRVADMAGDLGARAGSLASDVAGRVGFGGDRTPGHTGNAMVDSEEGERGESGWVHQMTGAAQGAIRSVRDTGGAALERAGGYAGYAGDHATRIADQLNGAFQRNPLLMGAVGVMGGALLAALFPATRIEDELVGSTRDELWQKAEQAGQQAIERVRDVAQRSVGAAADAAYSTAKEAAEKLVPKEGEEQGSSSGPGASG
ncbi:MAG: DUF3618 domain-containing protein [Alphaproteobacteria bacterium]|nr:DUF3618 domain-containing protein [Alphaproteobacteria bacterium]MBV9861066.1 DUF3618 domain-containing protein [Alphaproteobacteria bacterium]